MNRLQPAGRRGVVAVQIAASIAAAIACQNGQYSPSKDGSCLPCESLCYSRKLVGHQCSDYCKGYVRCQPGYYYDVNLSGCDVCSSICKHHKTRGTSDDCKQFCPNEYADTLSDNCLEGSYFDPKNDECISCTLLCSNQTQVAETPKCSKSCNKDNQLFPDISKETNNIWIWIAVALVVILVFALSSIFYIMGHRAKRRKNTPPVEDENLQLSPRGPFVRISNPLHAQCDDDDGYISQTSASLQIVDETSGLVAEEENKFPSAFPDLPYSARLVSEFDI